MNHPNANYGWLSAADVAKVFNVSRRSFERTYAHLAGDDAVRVIDGERRYLCAVIVRRWIASRVAKAVASVKRRDNAQGLAPRWR